MPTTDTATDDDITVVYYDRRGLEIHRRDMPRDLMVDVAMIDKPIYFQWFDDDDQPRRFRVEREHAALTLKRGILTAREF